MGNSGQRYAAGPLPGPAEKITVVQDAEKSNQAEGRPMTDEAKGMGEGELDRDDPDRQVGDGGPRGEGVATVSA